MREPGSSTDPPDADHASASPAVPRGSYPADFDANTLAIAVIGRDGRIQAVNRAFVDEVGLGPDDVVGVPVTQLWRITADDEAEIDARIAAEGLYLFATEPASPTAGVAVAMLQFVPLLDDRGGRVGTAMSPITDATRRDKQQRTLTVGFQLSFDQIAVGMLMTGVDGYVTRANPAMQSMLGRTLEEIAADDVVGIIHPEHRSGAVELGWQLLSGERDAYSLETRLLRADGTAFWVHESTTCIRDDDGQALYFASQFVDIDDRKRAEAERDAALAELTQALASLRESESKFKFLVQGIPVPLVEIDRDHRICSANPALTELVGRDPIGLRIHDIVVDTDVESARQQFWDDRLGPDSIMDVRIRRADGTERWVRSHARIHTDDDGTFVLATATWTDITDSRRETAELRRQASTDALTGLANRVTLFDRLGTALAAADGPKSVAVLFVDLDHFKPINDGWGHEAGDELLGIVAERLRHCARQRDVVGRIGGDEFVIVVEPGASDGAEALGERIVRVLGQPFDLSFGTVTIGASVGLAFGGADSDPRELIRRADMAAYRAKAAGRARLIVSAT